MPYRCIMKCRERTVIGNEVRQRKQGTSAVFIKGQK
jgi:hypothetical protein